MSNEEALHPGDKIRYWPGFREGGSSVGEVISERTVLGGHTTGYFIRKSNGGTDFIAETHIEPLESSASPVAASSPSRPAPRDAKSARDVIADEVKPPIHEPVATEVALAAADRLLAVLSAAGYEIVEAER